MPIRNSKVINFHAKSLSDTFDSTNVFPGAMAMLSNLIPAPQTADAWVPRPASTLDHTFTFGGGATALAGEALFSIGPRIYGFIQISGGAFPGQSIPFIFDTQASAVVAISGLLVSNLPTSTSNTGDWVPPTIDQVGAYVIFTHPGFTLPNAFGWLDMSGFSTTVTGDTNTNTTITGNPALAGLNPGMTVTGTNIAANTRVVSTAPFTLTESGTTHTNTTLDGLASTTGLAVGTAIAPNPTLGIGSGVTVTAVGAGSVTMSAAATASATANVTFNGATITISIAATGSANGSTFTIAGGTFAAPLWAAGNLNTTPLVAVATAVAQYAGSACYAVNTTSPPSAAVVFSDAGNPLTCTNAPVNQILTFRNAIPVTALKGLPLQSPLTGGIIQSLIAFQGPSAVQQITGAPITTNVAVNSLNEATGTLAPNSIQSTPKGLVFAAPDGLREINYFGVISDVLGRRGGGVTTPFLFAVTPSRMAAAYNESVYRISVVNGSVAGTPTQEYWYHEDDKLWTGPHTFPFALLVATQQPHSFAGFAVGINAKLWNTDAYASQAATYVENGVQMTFSWQTSLLPDTQAMNMNGMIQTNLAIAIPAQQQVQVTATDESSNVLGVAQLDGMGTAPALWGTMVWGTGMWGAGASYFRQRHVLWPAPIVFKQMQVQVAGECVGGLEIGNLYMRYSELGYNLLTNTAAA